MTHLGKLDVIALVDTDLNPVQDAVVGLLVDIVNDDNTSTALELFAPDFAESHGGLAGELGTHLHKGSVLAGAVPDGDELLGFVEAVLLQPSAHKTHQCQHRSKCATKLLGAVMVLLLEGRLANTGRLLLLSFLVDVVGDVLECLTATGIIAPRVVGHLDGFARLQTKCLVSMGISMLGEVLDAASA